MKAWPALLLWVAMSARAAGVVPASGTIEPLFSPWDDAEGRIIHVLAGARNMLRVQAYLLTSRPLARALIEAHRRGVDVALLADREMVTKGENSQVPMLVAAGIPVRLEVRYAAAHNKIVIVDPLDSDSVVITGSYNFSYAAQARNAENLLVLRGNGALARAYLDNWQRHHGEALPYAEALLP